MKERAGKLVVWCLWRTKRLARAMNLLAFRRLIGASGRIQAWKLLGATITEPVRIGAGVQIPHRPSNVTIGEGSRLTGRVLILSWQPVTIGRNVIFNDEVALLAGGHDPHSPDFRANGAPIEIGDYAWLPVRVTILSGVKIGHAAVIGTGSVVSRDVPDYGIAVGNPAKVVKERARVDFTYLNK